MNHIGIHALVWAEGWSELGATCSLGLSFEADVSSEDEENRRRGEEVLRAAVRTAAELGSAFLCGVVYSAMGKYLPHEHRGARLSSSPSHSRRRSDSGAIPGKQLDRSRARAGRFHNLGRCVGACLHRRECIHDVDATREDAR
jgi:hypothetical protein